MEVVAIIAFFLSAVILIGLGIHIIPASQQCDLLPTTTFTTSTYNFAQTVTDEVVSNQFAGLSIQGDRLYALDLNAGSTSLQYFPIESGFTLGTGTSLQLGSNEDAKLLAVYQNHFVVIDDATDAIILYDFTDTGVSSRTVLAAGGAGGSFDDIALSADKLFATSTTSMHSFDIDYTARTLSVVKNLGDTVPLSRGVTFIGGDLYTTSETNSKIYRIPYNADADTIGTPIDVGDISTGRAPYFVANQGPLLLLGQQATGHIDLYITATYESSSWSQTCADNEQRSRDSYVLLAVIVLVIAAVAVLAAIRQLG